MRYIEKKTEPRELTDYKINQPTGLPPNYDSLPTYVKDAIYESLLKEQQYICCYCESRLEKEDYHIEHVRPQCSAGVDPTDYSKLACSCIGKTIKDMPLHCGHKKGKLIISITPYDKNCQRRFRYTADGQILHVEGDKHAERVIKILALNNDSLKAKRREVLSLYDDPILEADLIKKNMEEDMQSIDGKLPPYISMIEYHYGEGTFFD